MASHWIPLFLLASAVCSARCATIGEYVDATTPTTFRWELSNKYAQIKHDWATGEFITGSAESRDGSPECVLEHEVDCPPGHTRWHCYKCSINPAGQATVPPGHSCHLKFFRSLGVGDATCTLLNHQTPGNSTIINTGLYPRTFSSMRRKCTTPGKRGAALPPHPGSKDICAPHAEIHRERVLMAARNGVDPDTDTDMGCVDKGCGGMQCGKGGASGSCCSKGLCMRQAGYSRCSCTSDSSGSCYCAHTVVG